MRMKLVAALLAVVLGNLSTASFARDKNAEAEIMKIEKALLVTQTGEEVAQYFAPDSVMFDPMPPTFNGFSEIKKHMVEIYSALKNPRAEFLSIHVEADKNLGFAYSTQRMMSFDDKGAITFEMITRVTDCYRKINGRWLIVMNHTSLPVDMATGKAIFKAKL